MNADGIRGSLVGKFLADAAGAPFEFPIKGVEKTYTDDIRLHTTYKFRWQPAVCIPAGQVTDDSTMTCALIHSMETDYVASEAVLAYIDWSRTTPLVGANTRALFRDIKANTERGKLTGFCKKFARRFRRYPYFSKTKGATRRRILPLMCSFLVPLRKDKTGSSESVQSFSVDDPEQYTDFAPEQQSNGSLMRCSPLAVLEKDEPAIIDCYLTNPNRINVEASVCYIHAVRACLKGKTDKRAIYNEALEKATEPLVRKALMEAGYSMFRDVEQKKTKGWVLHTLYIAFYAFLHFDRFVDAMRWIIAEKKGDTDTNAAVAGALLGAYIGYDKLVEDPVVKHNWDIVRSVDTSLGDVEMEEKYHPSCLEQLVTRLCSLAGCPYTLPMVQSPYDMSVFHPTEDTPDTQGVEI